MVGADALLQHGLAPVAGNADVIRMVVFESLAGIVQWSHGVFWAALLAGVGLGAIGGLLAPPAAELFGQSARHLVVTPVLVAFFLFSTLSLIISVPYFSWISVSYFSWIEAFVRVSHDCIIVFCLERGPGFCRQSLGRPVPEVIVFSVTKSSKEKKKYSA